MNLNLAGHFAFKELKHQRSIMFQQYQIMLLVLVLLFSIEIKANLYPNEDKLIEWVESQVIIYTLKQQNFIADFSKQKWDVRGKCFGNLISPKFVLTVSSCILEERKRLVTDKIVKDLIEEARVTQVIFSALLCLPNNHILFLFSIYSGGLCKNSTIISS